MNVIINIIFVLFFASNAAAQDCATVIRGDKGLGAPVAVKSSTVVPGDLLILTTEDPESKLADQATVVQREYFPELYEAAQGARPSVMWLGVVEGTDGHEDPALWLTLYVERRGQCVFGRISDRVYGLSNEAPHQLWSAIRAWERKHPLDSLVDGRDPRIRWVR